MKKTINLSAALMIVTFIFLLCSDISADNYGDATARAIRKKITHDNIITFKVNGQQVRTTGWNIARFTTGNKVQLNITSNMHIDKRTINVNLNGDKAGSYLLASDGSLAASFYGSYAPDYTDLLTRYSFNEGEFNITEVDTIKGIVNGTFKGIVSDLQGNSFEITEGKIINGELKSSIQKF